MPDYIPAGDSELVSWTQNLITYARDNAAEMDVDVAHIAPLDPLLLKFSLALAKAKGPNRGKVDTQEKDDARDALVAAIRTFVMGYVMHNPAVTNSNKLAMGLHVHDPNHTPKPVPHTVPEVEVKRPDAMVLELHFRDEGSTKRGKPKDVNGVKISYGLLDTPPASAEDLPHSVFDTKSPFTMRFQESDLGKTFYFALRWENPRAEPGQWTLIQKAVVS
jgi:hypothetical protein